MRLRQHRFPSVSFGRQSAVHRAAARVGLRSAAALPLLLAVSLPTRVHGSELPPGDFRVRILSARSLPEGPSGRDPTVRNLGWRPSTDAPGRTTATYAFEFPDVTVETVGIGTNRFLRFRIPQTGVDEGVGRAGRPVYREIVRLTGSAEPALVVRVTDVAVFDVRPMGGGLPWVPNLEPVPKVPGATLAAAPEPGLEIDETDPADQSAARLRVLGVLGGTRVAAIEVLPVRYDRSKGTADLRRRVEVDVSLPAAVSVEGAAATAAAQSEKRILVIAADALAPALEPFAEFKRARGWAVDVARVGEAGSAAGDIRAYVARRFALVSTRPTHLLLVGDTDSIPAWIGDARQRPDTDLYYACMDGPGDWLADLHVGRFPARSAAHLAAMVRKTIAYESDGPALPWWTSQAAFASSEDHYDITEQTHEATIVRHFAPRGYGCHRLYRHTYGATRDALSATATRGLAWMTYSGHGYARKWRDPEFTVDDVYALANAADPVVLSFACDTGSYDDYDECFGESWLRATNGAAAFLGASRASYWNEDDILQKALFDAVFVDRHTRMGEVVTAARLRYLAHFGATAATREYFELYNFMGDPSLETAVLPGNSLRTPAWASRRLPGACMNDGEHLAVRLDVSVDPASPPSWLDVRERLPSDWIVLRSSWNGAVVTPAYAGGEYRWHLTGADAATGGALDYVTAAKGRPDTCFALAGVVGSDAGDAAVTGDAQVRTCEADTTKVTYPCSLLSGPVSLAVWDSLLSGWSHLEHLAHPAQVQVVLEPDRWQWIGLWDHGAARWVLGAWTASIASGGGRWIAHFPTDSPSPDPLRLPVETLSLPATAGHWLWLIWYDLSERSWRWNSQEPLLYSDGTVDFQVPAFGAWYFVHAYDFATGKWL